MWMRDASAQCAQIFVRQIKSFHLHVHRELGFRQEIDSEIYIVLFFHCSVGRSIGCCCAISCEKCKENTKGNIANKMK